MQTRITQWKCLQKNNENRGLGIKAGSVWKEDWPIWTISVQRDTSSEKICASFWVCLFNICFDVFSTFEYLKNCLYRLGSHWFLWQWQSAGFFKTLHDND